MKNFIELMLSLVMTVGAVSAILTPDVMEVIFKSSRSMIQPIYTGVYK